MPETTVPKDLFEQVSDSFHDRIHFIPRNEDIHSILVYIGLCTIILLLLCLICSMICKCIKLLKDDAMPKKKKVNPQVRRSRTNSLTSRQTLSLHQKQYSLLPIVRLSNADRQVSLISSPD